VPRACCDDHRASEEGNVQRYILVHVDEYSVGPLNRQSRLELVGSLGILHEQLRGEVIQREDQHAEGVALRKKCLRNRSRHWRERQFS
tara:strand:- start:77 stop:340 length:264 start_codon:yes stop_codon:yes gene_type:complete